MVILKSPLAVLLVYLGSIYFLVLMGADNYRAELNKALAMPNTAIWCILTVVQITVWTFLIGPAYRRLLQYRTQLRRQRFQVLGDLVTLFVVSVIFVISRYRNIQPTVVHGQSVKMALVTAFGVLVILPFLVGFRLASSEAGIFVAEPRDVNVLKRVDELRRSLQWFLIGAASVVAAAAVARGALRNAMVAIQPQQLPDVSGVILFATFCSGVLAMFYVPAHVSFVKAARSAVEHLTPGNSTNAQEWVAVMEQRARLETLLGLNVTAMSLMGEFGAVIAPVVGSAVSFLLRF